MNIQKCSLALLALAFCLTSEAAMAEDKAGGCDKAGPPQIQGQVVKVDTEQEKITVRDSTGTTHVFQASKETLKDYKVGDSIKAKQRCDK